MDVVAQAVQGGVTHVQLREKTAEKNQVIEIGRALKAGLDQYGVPLIVNDDVDVAIAISAAGVHVGQTDMPYLQAREKLGPDKIIGLSITTVAQAQAAQAYDVNYLGVGPVFATTTKLNAAPPLGIEGLQAIHQLTRHAVIAIGGIHVANVAQVMATGVAGVAVVAAICAAADPKSAAMMLRGAR